MAFVSPFAVVHVVNLAMLRYFVARTDATESLMAMGQNFLELNPLRVFHMPGTAAAEVSAVLLILAGAEHFALAGMLFQLLGLAAIGLWAARYTGPAVDILATATIVASMPTWNQMYLLGALCVPMALFLRERRDSVFTLLGFWIANYFTALAFIPALILANDKRKAILWMILGFLIGANVLAVYWPLSFIDAFLGKGGAGTGLPMSEWAQRVDPVWFLRLCSWNALLILPILRPSWLTLSLAVTMAGVAEVALIPRVITYGHFGIEVERYFILVPAIIGYAFLGLGGWVRKAALVVIVCISLLSLREYVVDQLRYLEGTPKTWVDDVQQYRTWQ